jgi:hypothetical protein
VIVAQAHSSLADPVTSSVPVAHGSAPQQSRATTRNVLPARSSAASSALIGTVPHAWSRILT